MQRLTRGSLFYLHVHTCTLVSPRYSISSICRLYGDGGRGFSSASVMVTTTLLCSQGVSLIYTWNKRERKRRRDLLAELSLVTLSKTEKTLPESAFFFSKLQFIYWSI